MIRIFIIFLLLTFPAFPQVPIQFYDFESNSNRSNSETAAELIINSVADDNLSSTGGALSRAEGNPSTGSSLYRASWEGNGLTDPGTGATEYLQFTVNSSDFAEIFVSTDAYGTMLIGSSGGVGLLYSTDGNTFSATSAFSLTTSFINYEWDLSVIAGIENISEITFRLYAYGDDPLLGTAEFYFDNLTISAKRITGSKTLADYSQIDDANGTADFPVFNSLFLDASSAEINLASNIIISDTLKFINGLLVTGSNTVQVDSNCIVDGYGSNSYVNGKFIHTFHTKPLSQPKFYPVGSTNNYRPAQITLTDVTTAGGVTVQHVESAPTYSSLTGVTNLSSTRYWSVDLENGMTFGVANTYGVELHFGTGDGIDDASVAKVVRGVNGGDWDEADNSGTGADWVFGSFNNPTDNDFTFGDDGSNPLPVELTKFDYYIENDNLLFYWTTATEINLFIFEVERRNAKTNRWEKRGFVVAAGVSNSPKNYSFFEEDPVIGNSFYRLKMIDNDGSYDYSKTLFVEYDGSITRIDNETNYTFKLYSNFPNPFNPETKITYSVPKESEVKLTVYNLTGEIVTDLVSTTKSAGIHNLIWDASNYSSGLYILRLIAASSDGEARYVETRKMILLK